MNKTTLQYVFKTRVEATFLGQNPKLNRIKGTFYSGRTVLSTPVIFKAVWCPYRKPAFFVLSVVKMYNHEKYDTALTL